MLSASDLGFRRGTEGSLSILSDLTPDQFLLTVASGDSKALTRAKGIGAKSAQRIVMELKDKIAGDATGLLSGTAGAGEIAAATQSGGNVGEAIEALGHTGLYPERSGTDRGKAGSVPVVLRPDSAGVTGIRKTA